MYLQQSDILFWSNTKICPPNYCKFLNGGRDIMCMSTHARHVMCARPSKWMELNRTFSLYRADCILIALKSYLENMRQLSQLSLLFLQTLRREILIQRIMELELHRSNIIIVLTLWKQNRSNTLYQLHTPLTLSPRRPTLKIHFDDRPSSRLFLGLRSGQFPNKMDRPHFFEIRILVTYPDPLHSC
jgi:hypothetical protein